MIAASSRAEFSLKRLSFFPEPALPRLSPFREASDHMPKCRAGGYNTCEIKNQTILRLGPGGDKSGVSVKGRPSC
jgi:hypothetical protein